MTASSSGDASAASAPADVAYDARTARAESARSAAVRDARVAEGLRRAAERRAAAPIDDPEAVRAAAAAVRIRELEQVVSVLFLGLRATRQDLERAAASRAWRYGHAFTKAATRMTLRRARTAGALSRALDRIDEAETVAIGGGEGEAQTRLDELEQLAAGLDRLLADVMADVRRAVESRAWRYGHAATRLAWRVMRREIRTRGALVRALERLEQVHRATATSARLEKAPVELGERSASTDASDVANYSHGERVARDVRARLGDPPPLSGEAPSVSIIVREVGTGFDLGLFTAALAELTDYPSFEVIPSGTQGPDAALQPHDAVGAARHDLILFMDSAITPLESGWLRELVAVRGLGSRAVGATLVDTSRGGDGATVVNRGARLALQNGMVSLQRDGEGSLVFSDRLGELAPVTAVSDACMLIDRSTFLRLGGFDPAFAGDGRGFDLCLRLKRDHGHAMLSGRSLVGVERGAYAVNLDAARELDDQLVQERWAPSLSRDHRLSLLRGEIGQGGASARPQVVIVGTQAADTSSPSRGLRDIVVAAGFDVAPTTAASEGRSVPEETAYVVCASPEFDPSSVPPAMRLIGWVSDDAAAWSISPALQRADLVVACSPRLASEVLERSGRRASVLTLEGSADGSPSPHDLTRAASELRGLLVELEAGTSFALTIGAPDTASAERGGDFHYAEALQRALCNHGCLSRVSTRDEWDAVDMLQMDVALHLRGRGRYLPKPGQFNVLWCYSHPDDVSPEECDAYDLVFVASETHAAVLAEETTTRVVPLEQATDPARFFPEPDQRLTHDLVYVANSRGVSRSIVRNLFPTDLDVGVWGRGWEGVVESDKLEADHVENIQLRRVYSSAKIVLVDHWDDMREKGFVSNRVFDALACGALVISDDVPGLAGRFGEAVATYGDAAELKRVIARLLALDDGTRSRIGEDARRQVLARDTFAVRVATLLEEIEASRDTVALPSSPGRAAVSDT